MSVLGIIFVILGGTGLLWFGFPAVIGVSEVIASRTTGHPLPDERFQAVKENLYRLSGSVVFLAAGMTLIRFFGGA